MRHLAPFVFLVVFSYGLFAQDAPATDGASPPVAQGTFWTLGAGVSPSLLLSGRLRAGIGGFISGEFFAYPPFSLGVRSGFNYSGFGDETPLAGFETDFMVRFYWPIPRQYFMSAFVQGNGGFLVTLREFDGGTGSGGAPVVGGGLGARFFLPRDFFLDVYARGGYPYLVDGGIVFGHQFNVPPRPPKPQKITKPAQSDAEAVVIAANAPPPLVFSPLIFAPNRADFKDIPQSVDDMNVAALDEIIKTMKEIPGEPVLLIVGNANAVEGTNTEKAELLELGHKRALAAANILAGLGIAPTRLITASSADAWSLVSPQQRESWMLNRRVEFVLVEQGANPLTDAIIDAAKTGIARPAPPPAKPLVTESAKPSTPAKPPAAPIPPALMQSDIEPPSGGEIIVPPDDDNILKYYEDEEDALHDGIGPRTEFGTFDYDVFKNTTLREFYEPPAEY